MRANPVFPGEWDPPGGPRNAMFDVGHRVKYIGEDLGYLTHGSLGTVERVNVNASGLSDGSTYLTYDVRFDHRPGSVYWFLASELASGYQTNPIYPAEWHPSPKFKTGDKVWFITRGELRYKGTVLKAIATAWGWEYTVRSEDLYSFGSTGKLSENKLSKRTLENPPIYPDEWPQEFKIGDRVVIEDGSTWSMSRLRIGTVTHVDKNTWAYVTLDSTGRQTTVNMDDLRLADKLDEDIGRLHS